MKYSIITVCYNSEQTIERTIKSVLAQTYKDYEYIIIDGGSKDATLSIIDSYKEKFADKLIVVSEPDKGIYDAMNKGIKLAKGQLIGIVNSDDYYEPTALDSIDKVYQGGDFEIVYGMIRNVKDGKELMVYSKNPDFLHENMIAHPGCFVPKKLYDELGVYSLDYKYSADYEFMLRVKKDERVSFTGTYDIISNFTIGGASGSGRAYLETMNLRYSYGLMSKKAFRKASLKCKIALFIRRE